MSKRFLVPINLAVLIADPQNARDGDLYFNSLTDTIRVYSNGVWNNVGGEGGSVVEYTGNPEQVSTAWWLGS